MNNKYYVYVLRCFDTTLYTGITTDIIRRVKEHNGELPNGARYTQGRRPVRLVYSSGHTNRSEASKEESRIKKLSRFKKQQLIDLVN